MALLSKTPTGVISCASSVPRPTTLLRRQTTLSAHNQQRKISSSSSRRTHTLIIRAQAQQTDERPATSTEQEGSTESFWRNTWYPIAYNHDIVKPYPFTLLNEPIVIWKDDKGQFHAFKDVCPHRLVPLSEGRVATVDGTSFLECPYHGWRFNAEGDCIAIPQGGDNENQRACAVAYQCIEKQDMVWVKLQPAKPQLTDSDLADLPLLPELDDPSWGLETAPMYRDLPMDYATLIENVVDASHVTFTHHASVSRRQSTSSFDDMKVTDKGDWGFTGTWPTGPRKGTLGAQDTVFKGNLMRHTIDAYDTKGFANVTAVYGVPISEGRSRVIVRQPFKFKNPIVKTLFRILPTFLGHLGNLNVLDDDNAFLHWQEREAVLQGLSKKPVGQVYYMPSPADAYVIAFRQWLDKHGGGPFGPQDAQWLLKAGPKLPMEDLLDHYHSHVETCQICQTALKRVKLLQLASIVVGGLGAITAMSAALVQYSMNVAPVMVGKLPLVAVGGAVVAVAALIWSWTAKTLPRFYKGTSPPPRNTTPGEWVASL